LSNKIASALRGRTGGNRRKLQGIWRGYTTLRSASISRLLVPPVKLSTVGSRAFNVAGPRVMEPAAGGDHVSSVTVDIPSASQDIPLREILSRCHSMKLKRCCLLDFLSFLTVIFYLLFLCFSSSYST